MNRQAGLDEFDLQAEREGNAIGQMVRNTPHAIPGKRLQGSMGFMTLKTAETRYGKFAKAPERG